MDWAKVEGRAYERGLKTQSEMLREVTEMTQNETQIQALRTFAEDMKQGFACVKKKQDHEAISKLKPFVELMEKSDTKHVRLFVYYAMAQFRTGDVDGFLQTYGKIQDVQMESAEEESLKKQLDQWFVTLMKEMDQQEKKQ
ncbi:hypothetical protein [Shouchella shacheensis]|uniref:hypothetical protein n=1 Tax=Shouchella shacheensis TaxID=1649580 RepID=UPI00073FF76A|nr:hypothetical protein [Shouchella shacheensis]